MMMNNLIPQSSKIRVEWYDKPENYSREAKNKIANHFAKKYKVKKDNIDVSYYPVKINELGETIKIDGGTIDNIMDLTYQRKLMDEWIKRNNVTVDYTRILALDDKINAELDVEDTQSTQKKWVLKWISVDNFLSFGEKNYLPFDKLKGLTVVNSVPQNQSGKCIRFNTNVKVSFNEEEIVKKLGFLPNELI